MLNASPIQNPFTHGRALRRQKAPKDAARICTRSRRGAQRAKRSMHYAAEGSRRRLRAQRQAARSRTPGMAG
ncbi:MAG: hypothetical protein RLZ98_3647 [Pseudomonadota bacterium]|jgi:hypothetical protein